MTSTESGQARAAMLMSAARRSHFVARIQKYEAKVKLEQRRRELQREKAQQIAMTLKEQQSISWQSPESPLLPNVGVSMEDFIISPLQNQWETEGVSGSSVGVDPEDTNILIQGPIPKGMSKRVGRTIIVSGFARTDINPSQHSGTYVALKPSAALDVDITAIAKALEVKIRKADMAGVMQEHAFRCARQILKTSEKLMSKQTAYTLKKEFDQVYGPAWHCIVGKSFGSYVTHSVGGFVYFTMGKASILLFKTTVELVEHS